MVKGEEEKGTGRGRVGGGEGGVGVDGRGAGKTKTKKRCHMMQERNVASQAVCCLDLSSWCSVSFIPQLHFDKLFILAIISGRFFLKIVSLYALYFRFNSTP